jgi:hypothetical protein
VLAAAGDPRAERPEGRNLAGPGRVFVGVDRKDSGMTRLVEKRLRAHFADPASLPDLPGPAADLAVQQARHVWLAAGRARAAPSRSERRAARRYLRRRG